MSNGGSSFLYGHACTVAELSSLSIDLGINALHTQIDLTNIGVLLKHRFANVISRRCSSLSSV